VTIACDAGNLDIYVLGMQYKKDEIYDKSTRAQSYPIDPVEVSSARCQERVVQDARIDGEKARYAPRADLNAPVRQRPLHNLASFRYTTSGNRTAKKPNSP
jgi:hypothetical protein